MKFSIAVLVLVLTGCLHAQTQKWGTTTWLPDGGYVCGVFDAKGILRTSDKACKEPSTAEIAAHKPKKNSVKKAPSITCSGGCGGVHPITENDMCDDVNCWGKPVQKEIKGEILPDLHAVIESGRCLSTDESEECMKSRGQESAPCSCFPGQDKPLCPSCQAKDETAALEKLAPTKDHVPESGFVLSAPIVQGPIHLETNEMTDDHGYHYYIDSPDKSYHCYVVSMLEERPHNAFDPGIASFTLACVKVQK